MASTHLAHPDLALAEFCRSEPDKMLNISYNRSGEKLTWPSEMPPKTLMPWSTILSAKELCSPLYPEAPLLSGMGATSEFCLHLKIFEWTSLLYFKVDELNSATHSKLNIVFEELEKKFRFSSTESKWPWTNAGPMIWTDLPAINKMENGIVKLGRRGDGTWTTA